MNESQPKVSVVLNTCNRGAYIGDTLEGLKRQTYDNFEVVVVNGPSIDDTEEIVGRYNVRYYTAPFNISVSRNVGIKHAAGEIIAFIDDDAVPEAEWLEDIVKAYEDPTVAAAGGRVFNADGSDFQYSYGVIDLWGYPASRHDKAYDDNDSNGIWFNINIGTNASYRREPLLEVGGFDEEIEYYHDESDVCVRLIQAGYKVAQLENAYVHHKMAPSFRRKNSKKTVVWDAIVKNTIYYGLKHTAGRKALWRRLLVPGWREKKKLLAPAYLLKTGDFSLWEAIVRFFSLVRAFWRGYWRGFFHERKLIRDYVYAPQEFLPYKKPGDRPERPLTIVLCNQDFPPDNFSGNTRHNYVLANELTRKGHNVFVVSSLKKGNKPTISYQYGAWVYRYPAKQYEYATTGFGRSDRQLAVARGVLETVRRINDKHPIDFILVPVWDVEGLGILTHKVAPTMLSLMSPLKKVVETQWFNANDPSYDITYEFERYCVLHADAVMPISHDIKKTIGKLYDVNWEQVESKVPVKMIPLGVDPQMRVTQEELDAWYAEKRDKVTVLFDGRPERRKGIDLLLECIPKIMEKHPNVEFEFIGGKEGVDENGKSYFGEFDKKYGGKRWFKQLHNNGYVDDPEWARLYKSCDIFVAPSRYESFGQIYIQAMAAGKPVIGTNVGGIPEVVRDGVNGILIRNENANDLLEALLALIESHELREKMGRASFKITKEEYDSTAWADKFIEFGLEMVDNIKRRSGSA